MMHFRRALSQLRQRLDAQPRPAIEDMTPEERWERVKEIIDTAIARKKAGWPIPPRTPAQIAADCGRQPVPQPTPPLPPPAPRPDRDVGRHADAGGDGGRRRRAPPSRTARLAAALSRRRPPPSPAGSTPHCRCRRASGSPAQSLSKAGVRGGGVPRPRGGGGGWRHDGRGRATTAGCAPASLVPGTSRPALARPRRPGRRDA